MAIVFVALVAGAAELVRATCRRQVRSSIMAAREQAATVMPAVQPAVEPVQS